jgi:hypothetical protein
MSRLSQLKVAGICPVETETDEDHIWFVPIALHLGD